MHFLLCVIQFYCSLALLVSVLRVRRAIIVANEFGIYWLLNWTFILSTHYCCQFLWVSLNFVNWLVGVKEEVGDIIFDNVFFSP